MGKSTSSAGFSLFLSVFAILSLFSQAARADSYWSERIVATAADQRDQAAQSVNRAEERVSIAKADLSAAQSAAMAARRSKNVEASSIAREAEDVAADELKTAKELLKKAAAYLKEKEQVLSGVKKAFAAEESGARGAVIPEKGNVQRYAAEGASISDYSQPLLPGERIHVGPGGQAHLVVSKGDAEIVLQEATTMKILKDDLAGLEAELADGIAYINARIKRWGEKKLTVRTPSAVTSVRGTEFSIRVSGAKTIVQVMKGCVVVAPTNRKEVLTLEPGESATIAPEGVSKTVSSQDGHGTPGGKASVPVQ